MFLKVGKYVINKSAIAYVELTGVKRVSYVQSEDGTLEPVVSIDSTNAKYFSGRGEGASLVDISDLSLDDIGEVAIFFLTTYSREAEQNPAYLSFRGEQARVIWAYFQDSDRVETLIFNE